MERRILRAMGDGPATRGTPADGPGPPTQRPERWSVQWFSTLDSTNRWLLDQARQGAPAGLVAVADHQDAGRGRRGRTWDAPPGTSLLVSVLLRPRLAPEQLHVVTMTTALALADAVMQVSGVAPGLKWPNDLVVRDRKLAGLLAEADIAGDGVRAVVIGAGCNLGQTSFPDELAPIATSCFLESGRAPDRDAVLDALLARLDELLDAPRGAVLDAYRARLTTIGRDVRVDLGGRVVTGRVRDVDEQGRLIIDPAPGGPATGDPVVVAVGDVVHVRPS